MVLDEAKFEHEDAVYVGQFAGFEGDGRLSELVVGYREVAKFALVRRSRSSGNAPGPDSVPCRGWFPLGCAGATRCVAR